MKKTNENTIYFKTFEDDVVISKNQNYKIKENYKWIHTHPIYKITSCIMYKIASIFGYFYCKINLKIQIENKKVLKNYKKQGYFLYANHTQPVGDVFIPNEICRPKRTYIVVSQANLGIPVIGKLLPMLGALPISSSINNTKKLYDAINKRINEGNCVVIYPEAHVWPYYTKIREFSNTSFKFPVELDKPSFCVTTTYYKKSKKPGIRIFIDGPFFPDKNLTKKDRAKKLHDDIYYTMKKRAENSNYEYIKYRKEEKE